MNCSDCPPAGYPTDKTRCDECPLKGQMSVWLVSPKATVRVLVDGKGIIREAAPLVRVFSGQPFRNLTAWMGRKFGHIEAEVTWL